MNSPLAAIHPRPRTTATNEFPGKDVDGRRGSDPFGSLLEAVARPATAAPSASRSSSAPGSDPARAAGTLPSRRPGRGRPGSLDGDGLDPASPPPGWGWVRPDPLPTPVPGAPSGLGTGATPAAGEEAILTFGTVGAGGSGTEPEFPATTSGLAAGGPGEGGAGPSADAVGPTMATGEPAPGKPEKDAAPGGLPEGWAELLEPVCTKEDARVSSPPVEAGLPEFPTPEPAGTSGADEATTMTAAWHMTKSSGFAGQELPGELRAAAGWTDLDDVEQDRRVEGTTRGTWPLTSPGQGQPAATISGAEPRLSEVLAATAPVALPHLAGQVEDAVLRLHRTADDAMEVTIQPDAGTEIRLFISLREGGGPEVRAELTRGDAAQFGTRWHELQERLALQGFRLAAWTGSSGSSGGSPRGSGGAPASEPDELPLPGPARTPTEPARKTRTRSLFAWETWA